MWTEWANELFTNPPAGDFDEARNIAARAIREYQAAYVRIAAAGRGPFLLTTGDSQTRPARRESRLGLPGDG